MDVAAALDRALAALVPGIDLVHGRVASPDAPSWCEARGWTAFLRGLDDAELARAEVAGLEVVLEARLDAPASLLELARAARSATRVPALRAPRAVEGEVARGVRSRKRSQVPALVEALRGMAAHATRLVDVGAGSGHFTRVAADELATDALGLERDASRVTAATARAGSSTRARFVAFDASREALAFAPGDLAVGLHACGALGDAIVLAAARDGADLALVSCCLQKIPEPARGALSRRGAAAGLVVARDALGLSNLTTLEQGVEVALSETLVAREARYALAVLLARRGLDVAPGEEMRGVNRKRARRGLEALAAEALPQRGEPAATARELADAADRARRDVAILRRFSLPRAMFARLLELTFVLDRACALEEAGHAAAVVEAFPREVSPRNLLVLASRDAARLPIDGLS